VTLKFGNAGGLFMNAMTWYDHETRSIWSQPWGRAIKGELKGITLELLPSQLTTWSSWKAAHPETLLMTNDVDQLGFRRQKFQPDFVIGLTLAEQSKAYYFEDVQAAGVVNDLLGDIPVMVWAEDVIYQAYVRQVGERVLTFRFEGQKLVDAETSSEWDRDRGLAIAGPLKGESLQPVPSLSSYDWAWLDFYPDSTFYSPE